MTHLDANRGDFAVLHLAEWQLNLELTPSVGSVVALKVKVPPPVIHSDGDDLTGGWGAVRMGDQSLCTHTHTGTFSILIMIYVCVYIYIYINIYVHAVWK